MRTFTIIVVLVATLDGASHLNRNIHFSRVGENFFERLYQQLQSLLSILLGSPYIILSPSTARSGLLLG